MGTKLERAEAEALVAGALADWVRAAQRGADAVHQAMNRARSSSPEASWCGLDGVPPLFLHRSEGEDEKPLEGYQTWHMPPDLPTTHAAAGAYNSVNSEASDLFARSQTAQH